MPDLPTFTVTTEQAQRLLAAFGSADNYKAWLRTRIIEYVLGKERQAELIAVEDNQKVKQDELNVALGRTGPTP